MRIFTTRRFDRRLVSFAKSHPDLLSAVREMMVEISEDPLKPNLRTHKLSGPLKGCLAASINYEYRIVFTMDSDGVCFIDIGSHDDVYRLR